MFETLRNTIFSVTVLLAAGLLLSACGEIEPPRILETSVVRNTEDTSGPYQVLAVVVGDRTPLKVQLVYSIDGFATSKVLPMNKVSEDVYQAGIPGQAGGVTVDYYIQVEDEDGNKALDPKVVPPEETGLTYRFRILAAD